MKKICSNISFIVILLHIAICGKADPLPIRSGNRPKTTDGVPHKQIGIKAVKSINKELQKMTFLIPGIKKGASFTPYANAVGIHLSPNTPIKNFNALLSGKEFSHFHPDGSLHAPLSKNRAKEAVNAGWAVFHPWAHKKKGWEGLVLIYTPSSKKQQKVVFQLIVDSFNYVTGLDINAAKYFTQ